MEDQLKSNYEETYMELNFRDCDWIIKHSLVFNEDRDERYLTLDVEHLYEYKSSNLWFIKADIMLEMTNSKGKKVTIQKSCHFDHRSTSVNFGRFLTINESIAKKHPRQPNILINAHIHICSFNGIQESYIPRIGDKQSIFTRGLFSCNGIERNLRINTLINIESSVGAADFNTPRNNDSEVAIIVQDREFYVDKNLIMCFSSTFRNYFVATNKNEPTMISNAKRKTTHNHFESFIRLLYGEKQVITSRNVRNILDLARFMEVYFILMDCEDFLLSTQEVSIQQKCQLAKKFQLSRLQVSISKGKTTNHVKNVDAIKVEKENNTAYKRKWDDSGSKTKRLCQRSNHSSTIKLYKYNILLNSSNCLEPNIVENNNIDEYWYADCDPDDKTDTNYKVFLILFNSLCAALMWAPNRKKFLDGEGLQLMNLMLSEKKQSRQSALKVLDHATAGLEGMENCNKLVEMLGLRTIFPLFMRTPSKVKRKDTTLDEHEEHVCTILSSLLASCNEVHQQRIVQKFVEHEHEKVDIFELFLKYKEKVQRFELKKRKNAMETGSSEDDDPDRDYLDKLDNGLYTLQRLALIIADVAIGFPSGCVRAQKLFLMKLNAEKMN